MPISLSFDDWLVFSGVAVAGVALLVIVVPLRSG